MVSSMCKLAGGSLSGDDRLAVAIGPVAYGECEDCGRPDPRPNEAKNIHRESTQRHLNRYTPFFYVVCTRRPPKVTQRRDEKFAKSKVCRISD